VLCPFCAFDSTRVIETRMAGDDAIRRRRECERCHERFSTYERIEQTPVTVIKRDGKRERFDRQKLLSGLMRAANKRPVTDEQLEELAASIASAVRRAGSEVPAEQVGDLAERGLARLDPVSAIQFASVYRNLVDLDELEAVVRRYKEERLPGADQLPLGGSDPSDPDARLDGPTAGRSSDRKGAPKTLRRGHATHP
jgi:transcriptional repressor NrdR